MLGAAPSLLDAGQGADPRGEFEGVVSGRSEVTPLAVLGGVGVAVAVLFVVALAIVVVAYVLA